QHPVRPVDGAMTFTANQADAWVEIAFAGVGWVAFYPTPPRSQHQLPEQQPDRTSAKPADVQAQPPVSPPPNPANLQDTIKTNRHKAETPSTPFQMPAWVWLLLKIILYPLIMTAVIVGAITGYKSWRRKRRRTRGSPVDRITGAWVEMLDQLRDLGARVPRSGTRLEIVGGVADASWDQLGGFAAGVDAAMFGPDDPDDESVDSMWDWVEAERVGMLDGLGRKRRWRAKLNLASVWPWR
ncbi:MAG TPA: hypothetical protein VFN21_09385, partial [Acidimicrobiales bacterium]|nr:hypothetical protein [Acidimicrobiales bacterium]